MGLTLKQIEKLKKLVGPKTYFEELAEFGYLQEYLDTFLKERFENDLDFRLEMFELIQKYAKEPKEMIDNYYLQNLSLALDYFLENTKKWTTQKQ